MVKQAGKGPRPWDSFWRLLQDSDRRNGQMAAKVTALKSKLKQLEAVEKPLERREIRLEMIPRRQVHPHFLVEGKRLGKSFGEREVLQEVSFQIPAVTRIALTGDNGVGKTVLLQLL